MAINTSPYSNALSISDSLARDVVKRDRPVSHRETGLSRSRLLAARQRVLAVRDVDPAEEAGSAQIDGQPQPLGGLVRRSLNRDAGQVRDRLGAVDQTGGARRIGERPRLRSHWSTATCRCSSPVYSRSRIPRPHLPRSRFRRTGRQRENPDRNAGPGPARNKRRNKPGGETVFAGVLSRCRSA